MTDGFITKNHISPFCWKRWSSGRALGFGTRFYL